jgi:hypothetical protein
MHDFFRAQETGKDRQPGMEMLDSQSLTSD